jgi:hypothetical protein
MLVIDAGLTNELFIKIYRTFSEIAAALIGAGQPNPIRRPSRNWITINDYLRNVAMMSITEINWILQR